MASFVWVAVHVGCVSSRVAARPLFVSDVDRGCAGHCCSPKFVSERLLCHAILGRQGGKELIMAVDVSTEFISPLLDFSTKSVFFRVDKVCTLLLTHTLGGLSSLVGISVGLVGWLLAGCG